MVDRALRAGPMMTNNILLALYHTYVNASDGELSAWNTKREDVLWLIHHYEHELGDYGTTELNTIADQILTAFRAGQVK